MPGRVGRSFVEVGAGDGVTGSATLFLEKMMGWTGILIEVRVLRSEVLKGGMRGGVLHGVSSCFILDS